MPGPVAIFLAEDHRRLESLLNAACSADASIDSGKYNDFRTGILRHISMEEKILFPVIKQSDNPSVINTLRQIRLDHGAIAALLVLPPEQSVVDKLREILYAHNELEEGPDGAYDLCERTVGPGGDSVLELLVTMPEVPLSRYIDNPNAADAVRRAVERAGYSL
jgi:hypothetical protein